MDVANELLVTEGEGCEPGGLTASPRPDAFTATLAELPIALKWRFVGGDKGAVASQGTPRGSSTTCSPQVAGGWAVSEHVCTRGCLTSLRMSKGGFVKGRLGAEATAPIAHLFRHAILRTLSRTGSYKNTRACCCRHIARGLWHTLAPVLVVSHTRTHTRAFVHTQTHCKCTRTHARTSVHTCCTARTAALAGPLLRAPGY